MRRTIALLLIFLFLYNSFGYYGIYAVSFHNFQKKPAGQVPDQNLPGALTGEFPLSTENVHNRGEYLKLIKQTLQNDILHLVCFNHHEEKKFLSGLRDFMRRSMGHTTTTHHPLKRITGSFGKIYIGILEKLDLKKPCAFIVLFSNEFVESDIPSICQPVASPPPQVV